MRQHGGLRQMRERGQGARSRRGPQGPRCFSAPAERLQHQDERDKEQEIEQQFRLSVSGLEHEIAERNDQEQIRGRQRPQEARQDHPQQGNNPSDK